MAEGAVVESSEDVVQTYIFPFIPVQSPLKSYITKVEAQLPCVGLAC